MFRPLLCRLMAVTNLVAAVTLFSVGEEGLGWAMFCKGFLWRWLQLREES